MPTTLNVAQIRKTVDWGYEPVMSKISNQINTVFLNEKQKS